MFTVVSRTGEPQNCKWTRTDEFGNKDAAESMRKDCEKAGHKALVFKTSQLNAVGMPEGWDCISG